MKFMVVSYLLIAFSYASASGQAISTTLANEKDGFDVVSIRVNKSNSDLLGLTPTANGYKLTNVSLRRLLSIAYGLREGQISGLPSWARSARFDIDAKATDPDVAKVPLTWPQRQKYLAIVLAKRFQLMTHVDTRIGPIFRLRLIPGEQKLKQSSPVGSDHITEPNSESNPHGDIVSTNRFMRGTSVPMSLFTTNLQFLLERDVVDETGCTGLYDISLQWIPLEEQNPQVADPDSRSALFTALREQLGLRLVASTGPVQMLIVDHVEMPSAN